MKRVSKMESKDCVKVFQECCEFATKLRDKKRKEDQRTGHGRSEYNILIKSHHAQVSNQCCKVIRFFLPQMIFHHFVPTAVNSNEVDDFSDFGKESIRRYFPPSFEFKQIEVKEKIR